VACSRAYCEGYYGGVKREFVVGDDFATEIFFARGEDFLCAARGA
jgi:hypothetical protein